jgi:hypothetical protein
VLNKYAAWKLVKNPRYRKKCACEKSMERSGKSDERFKRKDDKFQGNSFGTLFEESEHLT